MLPVPQVSRKMPCSGPARGISLLPLPLAVKPVRSFCSSAVTHSLRGRVWKELLLVLWWLWRLLFPLPMEGAVRAANTDRPVSSWPRPHAHFAELKHPCGGKSARALIPSTVQCSSAMDVPPLTPSLALPVFALLPLAPCHPTLTLASGLCSRLGSCCLVSPSTYDASC